MTIKEKEKKIKEFEHNKEMLSYAIYKKIEKRLKNEVKRTNNKNNKN